MAAPAGAATTWQALKEAGNNAYKTGKIAEAVTHYSAALKAEDLSDADRATILCNRAQCALRLNDNEAAIADCTTCLTLQPENVKALFRRAAAYEALKDHAEAIRDYKAVLALDPALSEAATGVRRCEAAQRGGGAAAGGRKGGAAAASSGGGGGARFQLTEEDQRQFEEVVGRVRDVQRALVRAKEQARLASEEKKRADLTLAQVEPVGDAVPLYNSVGRMFVRTDKAAVVAELRDAAAKADTRGKVAVRTVEHHTQQAREADAAFMELQASFGRRAASAR